ncbi:MAG TPA: hypothetical protein VGM90_22125 [Kofleriaceae bacterium]|jgi:hypothetical protein
MAKANPRRDVDPRVQRLRDSVVHWRQHYERLSTGTASFAEWRRAQFEARRDFIIAQREYIELHTTLISHIKADTAVTRQRRLVQDSHAELDVFRGLLVAFDASVAKR